MKLDPAKISRRIAPLLRENGIERSFIYGSVINNTTNAKSDVDIAIEPPKGFSLLDLIRLERELTEVLGVPVDLVTVRELNPRFRAKALAEAFEVGA